MNAVSESRWEYEGYLFCPWTEREPKDILSALLNSDLLPQSLKEALTWKYTRTLKDSTFTHETTYIFDFKVSNGILPPRLRECFREKSFKVMNDSISISTETLPDILVIDAREGMSL